MNGRRGGKYEEECPRDVVVSDSEVVHKEGEDNRDDKGRE